MTVSEAIGWVFLWILLFFVIGILQVWLVFWAIDQLFHYHIDFTFWNVVAGMIILGSLSAKFAKKQD